MNVFGMVTTAASAQYTPYALRSFFGTTELAPDDEFFLIDNDNNFDAALLTDFPKVKLIRNVSPKGFSANANQMIDRALEKGAHLYFLNNDVIFTKGWFEVLSASGDVIAVPLCNREVQYASSVVVTDTKQVCNIFVCQMPMQLEHYLEHQAAFEYIADNHRRTAAGLWQVYVLPFYCVRIPLPILKAVGHFDESFGVGGGEDYDYALRTYLAGFSVKFALGCYLLHFGGKSTWSGPETEADRLAREEVFMDRFIEKWGSVLHQICLREKGELLEEHGLKELSEQGQIAHCIEKLKGDRPIEIRL